jgi:preprotein translocase subunit YajC
MIGAVKVRDTVITGGGLVGRVTKVEDQEVEIELAPNVKVRAMKAMLSDVRPHGTKPAND